MALLLPVVAAAPASACSEQSHCYLVVKYSSSTQLGNISGHLYYSGLSLPNPSTARINDEAWVDTSGNGSFATWIEQGVKTDWLRMGAVKRSLVLGRQATW